MSTSKCPGINDEERLALQVWMLDKIRRLTVIRDDHLIWTGPTKAETGYPFCRINLRGVAWEVQVRRYLFATSVMPVQRGWSVLPNCELDNECVSVAHSLVTLNRNGRRAANRRGAE